ncbi:MAG: SOS response-associated peptidase family protein [Planctomycetota bacterium]
MCSSYRVTPGLEDVVAALGGELAGEAFVWPDVVRITDPAPVVVDRVGTRCVGPMRFALIPRWSKTRRPTFASHNARIESVATKPVWREPFRRRRCAVPITEFIEPIYDGPFAGHMVRFFAPDAPLLLAAGVWDAWRDPRDASEVLHSFAVLTRPPSELVAETGHDRQPVLLEPAALDAWLTGGARESGELLDVLAAGAAAPVLAVAADRPMAPGWQRRAKRR